MLSRIDQEGARLLSDIIRSGNRGIRAPKQLRLLEVFPLAEVAAAIQDAIDRGALGFDAIKLLTLCRIEHRPAHLDLSGYPYLTKAVVKTTAASDYLALVAGRAA